MHAELTKPGLSALRVIPLVATLPSFYIGLTAIITPRGAVLKTWIEAHMRTVQELVSVVVQLVQGLRQWHAHGYVHGDIKPSNIVVVGMSVSPLRSSGGSADSDMGLEATSSESAGCASGSIGQRGLGVGVYFIDVDGASRHDSDLGSLDSASRWSASVRCAD